jgi:hypothetical protein
MRGEEEEDNLVGSSPAKLGRLRRRGDRRSSLSPRSACNRAVALRAWGRGQKALEAWKTVVRRWTSKLRLVVGGDVGSHSCSEQWLAAVSVHDTLSLLR